MTSSNNQARCLVFDIETAPMLAYVWGIRDQYIDINQIKSDWHVLAWAAKWLGDPASKVVYRDQRHAKNIEDDKAILTDLWKLLNEADIVVTQNGKEFDSKKINARFILNGMPPPSPYRHLDTYQIVRRVAGFTSNKLAYLTDKLCTKYKKLSHKQFPGFSLWKACLAGNKAAWNEMKIYNIHDVLSTEELYTKIQAWDSSINFGVYEVFTCACGSTDTQARGFNHNNTGKFQRFQCQGCGKWSASKTNLLTKAHKATLTKSAGAH